MPNSSHVISLGLVVLKISLLFHQQCVHVCDSLSALHISWDIRHIYREFNQTADTLSNQAIDERDSNGFSAILVVFSLCIMFTCPFPQLQSSLSDFRTALECQILCTCLFCFVQSHSACPKKKMTFQFQGVEFLVMEVFDFTQDKVLCSALFQQIVGHSSSRWRVLKIFSQILVRQLLPQFRLKSCFDGFFALFPVRKKCWRSPEFECEGARALGAHPRRRLITMPLLVMTSGYRIVNDDRTCAAGNRLPRPGLG